MQAFLNCYSNYWHQHLHCPSYGPPEAECFWPDRTMASGETVWRHIHIADVINHNNKHDITLSLIIIINVRVLCNRIQSLTCECAIDSQRSAHRTSKVASSPSEIFYKIQTPTSSLSRHIVIYLVFFQFWYMTICRLNELVGVCIL